MVSNAFVWSLLALSVVAEVAGNVALRHSDGFVRLVPTAAAGIAYLVAVWLMAVVMRHMEMGLTYAVWAACGTALTALVGIALYGEPVSGLKMMGLALIVAGVAALNLAPR